MILEDSFRVLLRQAPLFFTCTGPDMLSQLYQPAYLAILRGDLRLAHDDLVFMLVDESYVLDPTHDRVDMGTADDLQSHETAAVTNYERRAAALTIETDGEGRPYVRFDDVSWVNLGGGVNGTVGGVVLIRSSGEGDSAAMPVAWFRQAPHVTDGGTYTAEFEDDYQIRGTQS